MNTLLKFPFYAKASILLVGIYVLISMLYITQDIILPVIYASLIAILLSPVVNFLVRKKINIIVSIAMVVLLAFAFFAGIIILISMQASRFSEALPQLKVKFNELLNQTINWVSDYFNIGKPTMDKWITQTKNEASENSSEVIGATITTTGGMLATIFLTPVYTFMLLYYKVHLREFIHKLFSNRNNEKVNKILLETKIIVQRYMAGLFIELLIIALLNSVGLLILGIEYAVLLGVVGALLNIIPYIGGMIAMILFMLVAFVTKSPMHVVYVMVLYTSIQLIDNNYVVPKIVGSKVKLNAFISLLAVIVGAALWGIPGMFLSIPLAAIIKLILDRIEPLKPFGFLLGHSSPVIRTKIMKSAD